MKFIYDILNKSHREATEQKPSTSLAVVENRPSSDLTISGQAKDIFAAIKRDDPLILILGRAGTGKTTLIHSILDKGGPDQIVLAPTGVAAVNVRGQTINSFFRIPPRMHNLNEIQPRRNGTKLFKNLKRVIIDEISMVRADMIDSINHAMQINCRNTKPFGGVQMIFVGDFLQLPPVVRREEAEILKNMGYKTPFALSAKCLESLPTTVVELTKVHRQDNPEFIRLLGNIRSGEDLAGTIATLNEQCVGPHKREARPVILAGTNAAADRYNAEGLKNLPGEAVTFEGIISGEFNLEGDKLPTPDVLTLKLGARIMMVKNDPDKRWVNGTLGGITRLGKDKAWVRLDEHNKEYEVTRTSWENIRYEWDEQKQIVDADVVGSYTQIPVIPAWALTIHKAQGLTLHDVRIDLERGAFVSGQAYVALSRVRSMEGLSFTRPLRVSDIIIDPRLPELSASIEAITAKDATR